MKRILGMAVVAVALLAIGGCWLGENDPTGPRGKSAVEPDSVKGDTTYYTYRVRFAGYGTKEVVFATYGDRWHALRAPWARNQWLGLSGYVNLSSIDSKNETDQKAKTLIDSLSLGILAHSDGSVTYDVAISSSPYDPLSADVRLMEILTAFDSRPDVFKYVQPTIDDSPAVPR